MKTTSIGLTPTKPIISDFLQPGISPILINMFAFSYRETFIKLYFVLDFPLHFWLFNFTS